MSVQLEALERRELLGRWVPQGRVDLQVDQAELEVKVFKETLVLLVHPDLLEYWETPVHRDRMECLETLECLELQVTVEALAPREGWDCPVQQGRLVQLDRRVRQGLQELLDPTALLVNRVA